MGLNEGNCTDAVGRGKFANLFVPRSALHLHADLHHAPGAFIGPAHAPGVLGIERHGLFLVNIFARLDGGNEA